MDSTTKKTLRDFLKESLTDARDFQDFSDDSSLFATGRLDSLSILKLIAFLENLFDIDFSNVDFDVNLVDSLDNIEAFVDAKLGRQS